MERPFDLNALRGAAKAETPKTKAEKISELKDKIKGLEANADLPDPRSAFLSLPHEEQLATLARVNAELPPGERYGTVGEYVEDMGSGEVSLNSLRLQGARQKLAELLGEGEWY